MAYITVPQTVKAAQTNSVLIMALQTASLHSASDEVIVLTNVGLEHVDVKDWEIQYRSTAGTTWTTKATLTGVIAPRSYYLIATASMQTEMTKDTLQAGMAGGGGHIRITTPQSGGSQVIDLVGWGTAQYPSGSAAPAPVAGSLLVRRLDVDDMPINTSNNNADFIESDALPEIAVIEEILPDILDDLPAESPDELQYNDPVLVTPTPTLQEVVTLPTNQDVQVEVPENNTQVTAPGSDTLHSLVLTEVLPNPALPELDSVAEYVEIFNQGTASIDLSGYALFSGSSLTYHAALSGSLAAGEYRSFEAAQFRMALGNTTGRVELRFGQEIVDTVPTYSNAAEGVAWALIESVWQWTASPTKSAKNILTVIESQKSFATITKPTPTQKPKTTTPKATAKSSSKTTAKNPPKSATKSANKSTDSANSSAQEIYEEPAATNTKNVALLAGVGALAILYGLYEYRHDIANRIKRCRDYFSARRRNRGIIMRR